MRWNQSYVACFSGPLNLSLAAQQRPNVPTRTGDPTSGSGQGGAMPSADCQDLARFSGPVGIVARIRKKSPFKPPFQLSDQLRTLFLLAIALV